ncbi:MAG: hypothetical protein OEM38_00550 [Gammaproteobacteria bacterium]|nr:hypothetical protein [Gammaproteobacteria bacterium]
MKVKMLDLINSRNALGAMRQIPFRAIYGIKIGKAIKAINLELSEFDSIVKEKRDAITKNGEPTNEQIKDFESEVNEATSEDIDLDVQSVNFSWFAKKGGPITDETEWHDFAPANFELLDWLIVDDVN